MHRSNVEQRWWWLTNIMRFRLCMWCVLLPVLLCAIQGLPVTLNILPGPHRPPVCRLHVMYTTTDNSRKGCPQTYRRIRPLPRKTAIGDPSVRAHTGGVRNRTYGYYETLTGTWRYLTRIFHGHPETETWKLSGSIYLEHFWSHFITLVRVSSRRQYFKRHSSCNEDFSRSLRATHPRPGFQYAAPNQSFCNGISFVRA